MKEEKKKGGKREEEKKERKKVIFPKEKKSDIPCPFKVRGLKQTSNKPRLRMIIS